MTARHPSRLLALACAGLVALVPSCEWDGHFTVAGYTTRPNYDTNIRTVRVPIFKNLTFRPGIEFDMTRALVREIEAKTPYKVVSHCNADTELTGTIVGVQKNIVNVGQLNEIREGEMVLTVEVVWKDLRSGKILSRPARRPGEPLPIEALADAASRNSSLETGVQSSAVSPPAYPTRPEIPVGDPIVEGPGGPAVVTPLPGLPEPLPKPVMLSSRGNFVPELGQSITSALQLNVDRMAIQIVNMMEKPW